MPTDPVCGMFVPDSSRLKLSKDGKDYFFCSTDCLNKFKSPEEQIREVKNKLIVAWAFAIPVLAITYSGLGHKSFILLALTMPVQFYSGFGFYRGAYESIKNKMGNMDILITLGTLTAFFYSVFITFFPNAITNSVPYYDASVFIITLILTGNYLESITKKSAGDAAGKLMQSLPKIAHKVQGESIADVPADTLKTGDIIAVRAGEVIIADGTVLEGYGDIDTSTITGEQEPLFISKGEKVVSGTRNLNGSLSIRIERAGSDSTINKIFDMLQAASSGRAKIQRVADVFSSYFVPVVLVAASISAILWAFFINSSGSGQWDIPILAFVSVVVIACPCAIGLAAPITLLISSSFSYENGVILKNTSSLDRISKVNRVVFDKTGTLTDSIPSVEKVDSDIDLNELIVYAASVESHSNHPVAKAVMAYARERKIETIPASEVREIPGKGITGIVQNRNIEISRLKEDDASGIDVRIDGVVSGKLLLNYKVREGAKELIKNLNSEGIKTSLVTGDRKREAEKIGKTLGITEIHSEIDPEGKSKIIMEYQEKGDFVLFVGDGINDAVAMEIADAGIAVSDASDIAKEAGDIILARNDISLVYSVLRLSRETIRKVRQNIYWAIGYNSALIPIAGGILVPVLGLGIYSFLPILAALAMGMSSTSVVLNSLLLRIRLRKNVFQQSWSSPA